MDKYQDGINIEEFLSSYFSHYVGENARCPLFKEKYGEQACRVVHRKNGKPHREDGPAILLWNGEVRWYLCGYHVSEEVVNDPEVKERWMFKKTLECI